MMAIHDDKFQKDLKKFWKGSLKNLKIWQKEAAKLTRKGEKELTLAAKVGRAHLDVLNNKRKRDQVYQQIGERVVDLNQKGKVSPPELDSLISRASDFSKKIHSKEAALKKARSTTNRRKAKQD
jgi:hypothetical protein